MGAEPRMKLHGIVVTHYATPAKTGPARTVFRDIDLDISAAGLVITRADGIQVFFPAHMVIMAKFADRASFKAFDKDQDTEPQT